MEIIEVVMITAPFLSSNKKALISATLKNKQTFLLYPLLCPLLNGPAYVLVEYTRLDIS